MRVTTIRKQSHGPPLPHVHPLLIHLVNRRIQSNERMNDSDYPRALMSLVLLIYSLSSQFSSGIISYHPFFCPYVEYNRVIEASKSATTLMHQVHQMCLSRSTAPFRTTQIHRNRGALTRKEQGIVNHRQH